MTILQMLKQNRRHDEVDIHQTKQAHETGTAQIVDVREQDEWDAAHMADSLFIPLGELALRAGELDRSQPVIAICHSGSRSLVAVDILRNAGFSDVKSMAGGLVAWYQAGYSLTR